MKIKKDEYWLSELGRRVCVNNRDVGLEINAYRMQVDFMVQKLVNENEFMKKNRWKFWKRFPRA